jgi:hypothetical protein
VRLRALRALFGERTLTHSLHVFARDRQLEASGAIAAGLLHPAASPGASRCDTARRGAALATR